MLVKYMVQAIIKMEQQLYLEYDFFLIPEILTLELLDYMESNDE